MEKVGILGGTFNPVHYAHLFIAQNALFFGQLNRVLFIPNHLPPHKEMEELSPEPEDRFNMLKLAVADHLQFEVNRIELERKNRSYTIDTVKNLKALCPDSDFYFIAGVDSLIYYQWKSLEELLAELSGFILVNRQGAGFAEFEQWSLNSGLKNQENFIKLPLPELTISASEIRRRIKEGIPVKYLLPDPVINYINRNKLYRSEN